MAYDDVVQALGATAYYKGNDASGVLVNALTPSAHVTTVSGLSYRQARVLPGKGDVDQASVSMSATGDVVLPKAALSSLTGPWSLAFWASFQVATNGGTGQILVGCADTTGSRNGITIHSEAGMSQITLGVKGPANDYVVSFGVVPGGTFAVDGSGKLMVCATFTNGWASGSVATLYVGTLATLASGTSTFGSTVTPTTNPMHLGFVEDTFWQRLTGRLGNVGLWSRALSAVEVGTLYQAGFREGVSY